MIKPTQDYVIISLPKKEEKTSSGIYLPSTASESSPDTGIIEAIGPGRYLEGGKRIVPDFKVGDKVIFAKYAGTNIKVDNKNYLILRAYDIMAILN